MSRSTVRRLLKHSIDVSRLVAGEGVKEVFATVSEDVPALIQPLDAEAQAALGLNFTNAYRCVVELERDVLTGDRVVDHRSRSFNVQGVRIRDYGTLQHKELLLEADGSN